MIISSLNVFLWLLVVQELVTCVHSFVVVREMTIGTSSRRIPPCCPTTTSLYVARYGPPPEKASYPTNSGSDDGDSDDSGNDQEDQERRLLKLETAQRKLEFRNLIETCLATPNREHLPQIFSKNIELIMSLHGQEGAQVIQEILDEARNEEEGGGGGDGDQLYQQTVELLDSLLTFSQDFADQVLALDDHNKKLLGKIIRAMTGTIEGQFTEGGEQQGNSNNIMSSSTSKPTTDREREEALDQLMVTERDNFTPGFLRHIEGECSRILSARTMTRESSKLLEILRMIQTRVLEEIGKDMGEAAVVLGQLMGYDNNDELIGVLEAGLTVRGIEFAQELKVLTEEALDGFQRVPGGNVPKELVERVTLVDERLQSYLDENDGFQ